MTNKEIKALIELCVSGHCAITLEACQTGVVASVKSMRGKVVLETSEYLDRNDNEVAEKLDAAIKRVQ